MKDIFNQLTCKDIGITLQEMKITAFKSLFFTFGIFYQKLKHP